MLDVDRHINELRQELEALQDAGREVWLQAALAKAELRTELHQLEQRFYIAQAEILRLGAHTRRATHEVVHQVRVLMEELQSGYARIAREL